MSTEAAPAPAAANVVDERHTIDESPQVDAARGKLARALSDRPDKQELVEKGILKDSKLAPALQGAEEALKRSQLADTLDNKLQNRPKPEELVKSNILTADEVPPS
ncbi:hypothetical protein BKA62DRAFT_737363 [Auriculariales sp. MPI-PUGE-AT-0066]|nr:hypothetical protein BKA62DRAFT_737363 [Auriculariales sp. MPI-PUGE-AT-0066]